MTKNFRTFQKSHTSGWHLFHLSTGDILYCVDIDGKKVGRPRADLLATLYDVGGIAGTCTYCTHCIQMYCGALYVMNNVFYRV